MKSNLRKPKSIRRIILAAAAAAVVVVVVVCIGVLKSTTKNTHSVSVATLKKTTLQDTVDVSGTIYTEGPQNVYTTLQYPVAKINVSVGDKVKKGDILAVLDTSTLEKDVEQQQYATKSANDAASLTLQKAQSDYANALKQYHGDTSNAVLTAKSQLATAKTSLDAETSTLKYDQFLYQSGQFSKMDLDQEQSKYNSAQSSCDTAESTLMAARDQAKQTLDTAKNAYDTAVSKSADKSQQTALEKLEMNLKDSVITSPINGTITAKNVVVGAVPSGVLFTVENTDDMIVDAEIKEIDTASVKPGDHVMIKTDTMGTHQAEGTVETVAPVATSGTQNTNNVTYAAKIKVTKSDPSMKIGMQAKLNIIVRVDNGVYVVPYDTLMDNGNGTYTAFIAEKSGGSYIAKKITVGSGLQTDVAAEISGPDLKDGILIIDNPDTIASGDVLQLTEEG